MNLAAKLGIPSNTYLHDRATAWDYAQTNDLILWEADPRKDEIRSALKLFEADPALGFPKLLALAEAGSVWCMTNVASIYTNGEGGVVQSTEAAEAWFRRAFEGGSLRALLALGSLVYMRGDWATAEKVYEKGAALDWAPALYRLAYLRIKRTPNRSTYRAVRPLIERAAELGSPFGRWGLAKFMSRGRFGLAEIPKGLALMWRFAHDAGEQFDAEKALSPLPAAAGTVH